MKKLIFKGNSIEENGEILYQFDNEIQKVLEFKKKFLILTLNRDWKKVYNRNLFCFDSNGCLQWRNKDKFENTEFINTAAHYVDIWIEDDQLWAVNYFGSYKERLDIETGEVLESCYLK